MSMALCQYVGIYDSALMRPNGICTHRNGIGISFASYSMMEPLEFGCRICYCCVDGELARAVDVACRGSCVRTCC